MKHVASITSIIFALTTTQVIAGDVVKGESLFGKKCSTCHQVGPDAKNIVGPKLNNIVGNQVAGIPDYKYSPSLVALRDAGATWTEEELSEWLVNQKKYVRSKLDNKKAKSKMNFKLKKENERDDIIAYLASLAE